MTKISGWACDICRKEFREGDAGFSSNTPIDIVIIIQPEVSSEYIFEDTCISCRAKIDSAIQQVIRV